MNMFRKNLENRPATYSFDSSRRACLAARDNPRPGVALKNGAAGGFLSSFAAGPIVAGLLFAGTMAFSSCDFQKTNFDEYTNRNLIPSTDFDVWAADQPVNSLSTNAELPNVTITAGSPYMTFERIDNKTYPTDTGFANSAALYSGMPASVGTPPVYRLEVKNLLINGDFEDGAWSIPAIGDTTTAATAKTTLGNGVYAADADPASGSEPTVSNAGAGFGSSPGKSLNIGLKSSKNYLYFDFSQALAAGTFNASQVHSYNLNFDFQSSTNFFVAWGDGSSTNYGSLDVSYADAANLNTVQNFPTNTNPQISSFTTSGNGTDQYLSINPWILGSKSQAVISASFDNFSVLRTDLTYALSFNVSKLTAAQYNGSQLKLMNGGAYVFKVMVRADPTAGTNNRFVAKKVTLAIHGDVTRSGNYAAGQTFNASDSSGWAGWTEISIAVPNLLTNWTQYSNSADADNLLQLNITALDTKNPGDQVAGSILIAAPQLYWTPNP